MSHFQTLKEINDLGLLDKTGAVVPFVTEDGYSHTSTVNSTVNMRDEEDGNENKDDDEKEDVESPSDDDNNDRPKSSTSAKSLEDKLADAELNE